MRPYIIILFGLLQTGIALANETNTISQVWFEDGRYHVSLPRIHILPPSGTLKITDPLITYQAMLSSSDGVHFRFNPESIRNLQLEVTAQSLLSAHPWTINDDGFHCAAFQESYAADGYYESHFVSPNETTGENDWYGQAIGQYKIEAQQLYTRSSTYSVFMDSLDPVLHRYYESTLLFTESPGIHILFPVELQFWTSNEAEKEIQTGMHAGAMPEILGRCYAHQTIEHPPIAVPAPPTLPNTEATIPNPELIHPALLAQPARVVVTVAGYQLQIPKLRVNLGSGAEFYQADLTADDDFVFKLVQAQPYKMAQQQRLQQRLIGYWSTLPDCQNDVIQFAENNVYQRRLTHSSGQYRLGEKGDYELNGNIATVRVHRYSGYGDGIRESYLKTDDLYVFTQDPDVVVKFNQTIQTTPVKIGQLPTPPEVYFRCPDDTTLNQFDFAFQPYCDGVSGLECDAQPID